MRRGLACLVLGAAIAGCSNATPFPVSPLQVILGGWPGKDSTAQALARAYTIKGDTFAYPTVGLSISRPNQKDWEFLPTASGMAVLLRQGLTATEPRPSLQVSVFPEPEGGAVAEALRGDLITQFVSPEGQILPDAGVVTSEIGVDGIQGQQWVITQTPKETNEPVRVMRVYLVHEKQITLVQAQAEPGTFLQQLPAFESMLRTLRVPKSPNADPTGAAKSIELTRFDEITVPRLAVIDRAAALALGFSMKPVDPRVWLASAQGSAATLERRTAPASATLAPSLSVRVAGLSDVAAFIKGQDDERTALGKGGVPVTRTAGTLAGRPAEVWDFTQKLPTGADGYRSRRLRFIEGTTVALAQYTTDATLFAGLSPEFEALLVGLNVPKDAEAATKPAVAPILTPSAAPSAGSSAAPSAAPSTAPSAAPSAAP